MEYDPEIDVMQWMSVDQLARYSDALETIEREEVFYAGLADQIDPKKPLIQYKDAFESRCRLMAAMQVKMQVEGQTIERAKATYKAWDKFKATILASIEEWVDAGVTPGNENLLVFIHRAMLKAHAAAIKDDPDFQFVQIIGSDRQPVFFDGVHDLLNELDKAIKRVVSKYPDRFPTSQSPFD